MRREAIRCVKRSPEYRSVRHRLADLWPTDVWTDPEYAITFAIFDLKPAQHDQDGFDSAAFVLRLETATLLGAHTLELRGTDLEMTVKPIDTPTERSARDFI